MLEERATIMIVDDDRINIEILASGFSGTHKIVRCSEATQALEVASNHQPDVILLDVSMPILNGYQVCRQLKGDDKTRHIPVIFSTGRNSEADEIEGLNVGASDYITKPYRMELVKLRVENVLQLKRKTDLLEKLANLDGLTHIANRRHFDSAFQFFWQQGLVSQNPVGVLMIDIDFFKQFNDRYGHATGDRCLVNVASGLEKVCGPLNALPARYGGEEFVVVIPDADVNVVQQLAELIHQKIKEYNIPHEASDCAQLITVSIGGASLIPSEEHSKEVLLEAADKQLYQAKSNGRNQTLI